MKHWLVVWNICFFFHILGMSSQLLLTPSFFRGVGQPPTRTVVGIVRQSPSESADRKHRHTPGAQRDLSRPVGTVVSGRRWQKSDLTGEIWWCFSAGGSNPVGLWYTCRDSIRLWYIDSYFLVTNGYLFYIIHLMPNFTHCLIPIPLWWRNRMCPRLLEIPNGWCSRTAAMAC